jgi:hypothetical protein
MRSSTTSGGAQNEGLMAPIWGIGLQAFCTLHQSASLQRIWHFIEHPSSLRSASGATPT